MTTDHAAFADWDAAYVLGALSAADRRAFEEHLTDCAECRRAVAELAPTAGLLSRVGPERARELDGDVRDAEPGPDANMRAGIISLARERARRRRMRWIVAGAAAAVLLIVAAIAVPFVVSSVRPAPAAAMSAVADLPLSADVRLTDVAWGTRIELECRYEDASADAPPGGWPYALTVVGADGTSSTVSTWNALPGSTARLSAGTALEVAGIRAVEITSVATGRVLMRYDLAG